MTTPNDEVRCECGRLVARCAHTSVSVQCKRCKRQVELPHQLTAGEEVRCVCRRLLARGRQPLNDSDTAPAELSCPRCKRVVLVPLVNPAS